MIAHGARPNRRRRSINETNHKVDLFQGSNRHYIGDRKVHSNRISLQIHVIDHGISDDQIEEKEVGYLALWLPQEPREWEERWIQEI